MKISKDELGLIFVTCSDTFDVELGELCDWSRRKNEDVRKAQDALIAFLSNKSILSLKEIAEYMGASDQAELLRSMHNARLNTRDEIFERDNAWFVERVEAAISLE